MSKPAGTAEVDYGLNGVCHQTANRILLPARLRVSAARGYNVSFTAFGHYGRPWLPGWGRWLRRLATCKGQGPTSRLLTDYDDVTNQKVLGKDTPMADDLDHQDGGTRKGDLTLDDLLAFMQDEAGPLEQVRSMCDPHLERELSMEEANALLEIKRWFDAEQKTTVERLLEGIVDRDVYLGEMNSLLSLVMTRYRAVLGNDRFLQVFGDAGLEPENLIDRDIFLGDRR